MSHKSKNLIEQTINELKSMQAFGESRHIAKQDGATRGKIFSYSTFNTYKKQCCKFVLYCQKEHKSKTLSQTRAYVDEYLKLKIDHGYSPSTIKLMAASLGKLFHEPTSNFITTPTRNRDKITRSRLNCVRDKHFSKANNNELIEFCKSTGLRRRELENLKGSCLEQQGDNFFIQVTNGKGGKTRLVPILNNNPLVIAKIKSTNPNTRVWSKVHNACDIHGYRSEYANALYRQNARTIIPREDRYYCRKDLKGVILDRQAMQIVSRALGHNRIEVFAYSYYRK